MSTTCEVYGLVIAASTAVAVPLIIIRLTSTFPVGMTGKATNESLEKLRAQYEKWSLFAVVPFFLFVAGLTYLWQGLFFIVSAACQSAIKD